MGDRLVPSEVLALKPVWRNGFENPAMVQLVHRALTISTALLLLALAWRMLPRAGENRKLVIALGMVGLLQPALGIATLLTGVNIPLAVAHQAGAILLLTVMLTILYGIEAQEKAAPR